MTSQPKSQHTPLPWRTFLRADGTNYEIVAGARVNGDSVARISNMGAYPKADAAFIVRAVNAHAELMGALQALVDLTEIPADLPPGERRIRETLLENGRAALAKAEQGDA